MRKILLSAIVLTAGCTAGAQQSQETSSKTNQALTQLPRDDDDARKIPAHRLVTPGSTGATGPDGGATGPAGPWKQLQNLPPMYAGTALLLTDGTVMVQNFGTPDWWKLTPDAKGSYAAGTWTQLASMPNGYAPLYFASAVLPDGRVIVEGGEYQAYDPAWQTGGAIYDPTTNVWTPVAPPAGWQTIGDAQSIVLADGRFVLANCCTTEAAVLDPITLTWTPFGKGKADINDEEGWTLLPNKKVLTVDANNTTNLTNSEILAPDTQTWTSAGSTIVQIADLTDDGDGSREVGPAMLRPDGTVFVVGATGHTSIYDSHSSRWTVGPDFPVVAGEGQLDVADGPSALLPNGHVLVAASAGLFNTPLHVFEFDGAALNEIAPPPSAFFDSSYNTNFLLLPSGEVLLTDFSNDVEIYTPTGKANRHWAPSIEGCGLSQLDPGTTHRISGDRLNGLSQGVSYGDDAQAATNYPLVRITNRATGHVVYARTHDHSTMAIGPSTSGSTSFDVPATIELGESDLVVIANGIASDPVEVRIGGKRHW